MLGAHLKKNCRDIRVLLLLASLITMLAMAVKPAMLKSSPIYNFTFIVDITRSMNARDYQLQGVDVSRLDYVKNALRELVLSLPCGSKAGLGVFTDRQSSLLFDPVEVCGSRNEIDHVISELDWRMAWAADSRISKGLYKTIEMLKNRNTRIVFITDGQEAPPVNPRYQPDFSIFKDRVKGVMLGVGGLRNVPIPKFDLTGKSLGVYKVDEVPHRSTFGIPGRLPSGVGAVHARNAPFGGAKMSGDQHLTRLYESYLNQLSAELGWLYQRMDSTQAWKKKLLDKRFSQNLKTQRDIRGYYAMTALLLMVLLYCLPFDDLNKPERGGQRKLR